MVDLSGHTRYFAKESHSFITCSWSCIPCSSALCASRNESVVYLSVVAGQLEHSYSVNAILTHMLKCLV